MWGRDESRGVCCPHYLVINMVIPECSALAELTHLAGAGVKGAGVERRLGRLKGRQAPLRVECHPEAPTPSHQDPSYLGAK